MSRPIALLAVALIGLAALASPWGFVSTAQAAITFDDADVNDDGKVNSTDLLIVRLGKVAAADVNHDGVIDAADLTAVRDYYAGLVSGGVAPAVPSPTPAPPTGGRDPYGWPFASTSIWNMPIGSAAVYVPAGILPAYAWRRQIITDEEYLGLDPSDALRALNGGTSMVHVPADMAADGSWNGVAALLLEDGRHVAQGQPLLLTAGGDPSWAYGHATVDLYGDGIDGAHGGSGLSSFGGSIRKGELTSGAPLQHVLKVNLWARRFLSSSDGGYRWPARHADWYADATTYGGPVPQLRMGSLLALPANLDLNALGLQSAQALTIARALQDYGAYVADDTSWDVHAIDIERGAEFGDGGSFDADLQLVFTLLAVVDNNGPDSIGGGGTPRAPLAPPLVP